MKRRILMSGVALLLAACGGDDSTPTAQTSKTPKEQIAALEADGSIPKLDRTGTVAGTDANSNGVRDDVDAFIVSSYSAPSQRAAATQFAAVLQSAMLVDASNTSEVKAISVRGARAVNCIYTRFDGSGDTRQPGLVVEEIRSVSTNTKLRLLAYLSYSKALDGTSGALPEGDTCE